MPKFLFAVIVLMMSMSAMAKPVIVVLGDSISAGYGIEVEQGWVALLQKKLHETKRDYSISNASISGDTSAGDRKSTRLNSSHLKLSRMPSSA